MCCFYNSIFSTFIIIFYLFIYGLKCIQHVFIYSVFTECKALHRQFSRPVPHQEESTRFIFKTIFLTKHHLTLSFSPSSGSIFILTMGLHESR